MSTKDSKYDGDDSPESFNKKWIEAEKVGSCLKLGASVFYLCFIGINYLLLIKTYRLRL